MNRKWGDDDDEPKKPAAKPVPRRSALKTGGIAAAGVIGLAAAGAGYRANQTGALKSFSDGPGFEPVQAWQEQLDNAKKPATPLPESGDTPAVDAKGVIAAGLLAASPHNSQPWRFVVRDRVIDVFADEARNLGAVDPRRREMTIGLGCCIENVLIGASAVGVTPLLNLLPDGVDGKALARITLYNRARAVTKEAQALGARHTNRGPYIREREVDSKIIDSFNGLITSSLTKLVWLKANTDAGKRFAGATVKATADFIADEEMVAASNAWFRFSGSGHHDGLTLASVGLSPVKTRVAMMLPPELIGDPHKAWFEMTRDVHVATAPLFGLIAVPSLADRAALIEAGRLWQRMHVQATVFGLAVQPLNQLMEMVDRDQALKRPSEAEKALTSLSAVGSDVFAFAFRMGHSRFITNPSPRRGIDEVLGS